MSATGAEIVANEVCARLGRELVTFMRDLEMRMRRLALPG